MQSLLPVVVLPALYSSGSCHELCVAPSDEPGFGLFNTILEFLHLPKSQFFWGKGSVLPSIVFMGIWGTGSTQVIFLAGLQEIPQVYYEALEIDGGNSWDKFWNITLPMVSSTLFFNLVNGIIGALQVFSQAYIITEGGPNNASLFYVYNLWRQAFKYMDMGKASAMAWILFVVVMLLTVIVFKSSKNGFTTKGEMIKMKKRRRKTSYYIKQAAVYAVIILLALVCVIPLYWMVRSSFMKNTDIYSMRPFVFWPKESSGATTRTLSRLLISEDMRLTRSQSLRAA